MMRFRLTLLVAGTVLAALFGIATRAANAEKTLLSNQPTEVSRLLREIVLAHLPHEYENTKQWGGTKEVWDGLHVSMDGLRIKTKRRKKLAKHGTWKRYQAWLVDPQKNLRLRIANVGTEHDDRATFDVIMTAKLGAFGRLSEWNRDVQLVSVSVNADADLTLRLSCEMSLSLNFDHLPPDLQVEPRITDAELTLHRLRLQRISDLHGPLVRELGSSLETVLQKEFDRRRAKLAEKLNRQIQKRKDRLRFSIHELLSEDAPSLDSLGGTAPERPESLVRHGDRGNP